MPKLMPSSELFAEKVVALSPEAVQEASGCDPEDVVSMAFGAWMMVIVEAIEKGPDEYAKFADPEDAVAAYAKLNGLGKFAGDNPAGRAWMDDESSFADAVGSGITGGRTERASI